MFAHLDKILSFRYLHGSYSRIKNYAFGVPILFCLSSGYVEQFSVHEVVTTFEKSFWLLWFTKIASLHKNKKDWKYNKSGSYYIYLLFIHRLWCHRPLITCYHSNCVRCVGRVVFDFCNFMCALQVGSTHAPVLCLRWRFLRFWKAEACHHWKRSLLRHISVGVCDTTHLRRCFSAEFEFVS